MRENGIKNDSTKEDEKFVGEIIVKITLISFQVTPSLSRGSTSARR